jgi:hypothetical protein
MKQYLRNAGFLYPSVYYDKDFHNNDRGLADITYQIDPGKLYVLDTVNFYSQDTAIQYLLDDTKENSFLKKGSPLSQRLYEQERARITQVMNNFGYARFTPNFISQLEADTIDTGLDEAGNRKANVILKLQPPNDRPTHQKFYTADIIIYPNYDVIRGETIAKDTIVDGKIFFTYDGILGVKAGTLSNAIRMSPGEMYNKDKTDKTFQQINNLGIYRFVNIRPNIEECDSTMITYKVYLTPAKRMSFESGVELNWSNISTLTTTGERTSIGRIGSAIDFAFDHKNLLKGAERFKSVFSIGFDVGLTKQNTITRNLSFDIRQENTLSIPKFVNLTKSYHLYRKLKLVNQSFLNQMKDNGVTDLVLGFDYNDRLGLNLYKQQQFRLNHRFNVLKSNGFERYIINQTGVELNLGKIANNSPFANNERFKRSLQNQLITGLIFKRLTYERSQPVSLLNERWQFIAALEQSGSEVWLTERLFNRGKPFKLLGNLPFSKYWLGEFDVRFTKQYSTKRAFSAKAAIGLAVPIGNDPVPYSRQFFVGGPNSIRGWLLRQLGPGGYKEAQTPATATLPYQAGDFKFEFNSEYRFPLVWRFESALFFDFGNIWNLKVNEAQPDGHLNKFFYDQLAVSTGLGIRLDVTYALIRLDLGFKLRNPYSDEKGRNWIPLSKWRDSINPNFAMGLPF